MSADELFYGGPVGGGDDRYYRIGPIHCTETFAGMFIHYEVADVKDWEKCRCDAQISALRQR